MTNMKKLVASLSVIGLLAGCGSKAGTAVHFDSVSDINGNTYSSEQIFSANKVTMVNVWATTCTACIDEMPDLEKLNHEIEPQDMEIVGVVSDITSLDQKEPVKEAEDIIDTTGITFKTLLSWGNGDILNTAVTPITYFVDSQGKTIGDPVVGAQSVDNYKTALMKALKSVEQ